MASLEEQEVTSALQMTDSYHYFNGSGSCGALRQKWIGELPGVCESFGLSLEGAWLKHIKKMSRLDAIEGGNYVLTNTWVAISYAIQSAIQIKHGGKGLNPSLHQPSIPKDKRALAKQHWFMGF